MYYAPSTTHMKHIVKPDKGKGAYLNSREASLGTFFVWCILTGIATITTGAMLGTDVTKLIQMPTQPTQPLKP
jgi:hypothetical protein